MTRPKRTTASSPEDLVKLRAKILMKPREPLVEWTTTPSPTQPFALVVTGLTYADRQDALKGYVEGEWRKRHRSVVIDAFGPATGEWRDEGVTNSLTARIQRLALPHVDKASMAAWYPPQPGNWDLVWALIAVENFVVEHPLRAMIDHSFYLVHDVHRVLWEARFLAREQPTLQAAEALVDTFLRWITGRKLNERDQEALTALGIRKLVSSDTERFDVLCFLLTLGHHNGFLERAVFVFDGLERALEFDRRPVLRQLQTLLDRGRTWVKLGCPIGILVGFSGEKNDVKQLFRLNGKLGHDITNSLDWMQRP